MNELTILTIICIGYALFGLSICLYVDAKSKGSDFKTELKKLIKGMIKNKKG
jgi:hypothetical protein